MPLLADNVKSQLTQSLAGLTGPVRLIAFTQEMECQFCRENRQLVEEVASASDKIKVEVYNYVLDRPMVEKYAIERIPAIVVEGSKDYGIRFYGIPAGYEFASLIEAIKTVSSGAHGLSQATLERLKALTKPLRVQVFVTLTCPYCATQVRLVHQLAMASDLITGEMIESAEFPQLAHRFNVMAVPRTVVNEALFLEGAMSEEKFVDEVMQFALSPHAPLPAPIILPPTT
jgi:glutaredoxin-like protein